MRRQIAAVSCSRRGNEAEASQMTSRPASLRRRLHGLHCQQRRRVGNEHGPRFSGTLRPGIRCLCRLRSGLMRMGGCERKTAVNLVCMEFPQICRYSASLVMRSFKFVLAWMAFISCLAKRVLSKPPAAGSFTILRATSLTARRSIQNVSPIACTLFSMPMSLLTALIHLARSR